MVAVLRAVLLFVRGLLTAEFLTWLFTWGAETVDYVTNAACNPPTLGPIGETVARTTAVHSITITDPVSTIEVTASETTYETIQTAWHNPPIVEPERRNASIRVDEKICNFPHLFTTATVLPAWLKISDGFRLEEWERAARQLQELDRLSRENKGAILNRLRPYQYWRFRRELEDLVKKPLEFTCATLRRVQDRLVDIALDTLEPITSSERRRLVLDLLNVVGEDIVKYRRAIQERMIMPEWARWAPELQSDNCPGRVCMLMGDESIEAFAYGTTNDLLRSVWRVQITLDPKWAETSESYWMWVMRELKDFTTWFGFKWFLGSLFNLSLWMLGVTLWSIGKSIGFFFSILGRMVGITYQDVMNHGFDPPDMVDEEGSFNFQPGVLWKLFISMFLICSMLTLVTLIIRRQFSDEMNIMGTALRERPLPRPNRGLGPGPGGDDDAPGGDTPGRLQIEDGAGGNQEVGTQTAGALVVATQTEPN